MKTFAEFLALLNEEAKWTLSLFDHLFLDEDEFYKGNYIFSKENRSSFNLPLSTPFIKSISEPVEMIVMHSTGKEGLKKLLKLQNKKTKHLSAYTIDTYNTMRYGIWSDSGGGVLVLLQGEVLAGGKGDVQSRPDKKGIRVIDIGEDSYLYRHNKDFLTTEKDLTAYKNLLSELLKLKRSSIEEAKKHVESGGDKVNYEIDNKIKYEIIRKYIGITTQIIISNEEYKRVVNLMLLNWPKQQKRRHETIVTEDNYDELIISNFKVLKVYIFENVIADGFDVDMLKEKEIPYYIIENKYVPDGTHKLMLRDLHLFQKQI